MVIKTNNAISTNTKLAITQLRDLRRGELKITGIQTVDHDKIVACCLKFFEMYIHL